MSDWKLSKFDKEHPELIALAGINAIEQAHRHANAELLKALEERKTESERDRPFLTKEYKLLALNGDLIARCINCNGEMRFPPEYAGADAQCIHCKSSIQLYRREDTLEGTCPFCTKRVACYLTDEGRDGTCPHCRKVFTVARSSSNALYFTKPKLPPAPALRPAKQETPSYAVGCLVLLITVAVVGCGIYVWWRLLAP